MSTLEWMLAVPFALGILVAVAGGFKARRGTLKLYLRKRPGSHAQLWTLRNLEFLLVVTGLNIIMGCVLFWTADTELLAMADRNLSRSALSALMMIIVIPILEELVFRGYFLELFNKRRGLASIFSSLLFGLSHFPNFVSATFLGLRFSELRFRDQNSLRPSIRLHMALNLMAVGLDFLMRKFADSPVGEIPEPSVISGMFVAGLVLCAIGARGVARTIGFLRKQGNAVGVEIPV